MLIDKTKLRKLRIIFIINRDNIIIIIVRLILLKIPLDEKDVNSFL